jgi:Uncharacterized conserved protein
MINFQSVTIDDRSTIQSFFDRSSYQNCDFSFSNIFSWSHYYNTTFAIFENFLFFRFQPKEGKSGYLFPLGGENLKRALEILLWDSQERGDSIRVYGITPKMFSEIEQFFPRKFCYKKTRAWYEYIYSSEDLIHLTGKKFQAKRNHINKFRRTYEWEYLPISRGIIPDCLDLYERWCKENGGCKSEESLIEEYIATKKIFSNYESLQLSGGALRINGKILAYSFGQALRNDTFGVHAEKSLYEIDGGFTMMNQQFVEQNCSLYPFINREEDLGLESLRKSKLSYHPVILLEKGYVKEL